MTRLDNTLEGTNGSAIPASAIGAPNALDASSSSGTGTTKTFSNAHPHAGTTGVDFHLATVASTGYVEWFASITSASANVFSRAYCYMTAIPTLSTASAVVRLIAYLSTGTVGSTVCVIPTNAASNPGCLRINNTAGSDVVHSTTALPTNTLFRLEFDVTNMNGSTADVAARVYSGANLEGGTPDTGLSISASGVAVTTATANRIRFGPSASTTVTTAWDLWQDDVAYSDVGPIGGTGVAVGIPDVVMAPIVPVRYS